MAREAEPVISQIQLCELSDPKGLIRQFSFFGLNGEPEAPAFHRIAALRGDSKIFNNDIDTNVATPYFSRLVGVFNFLDPVLQTEPKLYGHFI